ncbi:MAG: VWA domain-containing protein, partial [Thermoanaerobaculia bacterium]|nr:VWA domain-containing protein [Thermoanaerobaculia bacterium]
MTRRPLLPLLLPLLLAAALPAAAADQDRPSRRELKQAEEELPERYRVFLLETGLLMSEEERISFLSLDKDYQRDAFIERFWRARDPYPETPRNEFRERWQVRVEEVRATIGDFTDERAEVLLLNGIPDARIVIDCAELWPAEVFYYARAENVGHEVVLLFYQVGGMGRYRIWYPTDNYRQLLRFPSPPLGTESVIQQLTGTCGIEEGDALVAALSLARSMGVLGLQSIVAKMVERPQPPSGEWVATFNAYTTDLPEGAASFDAELAFDFPGRRKSRTVVQGILSVDTESVGRATLAGHESYNFQLTGEVLADGRLFDSFRYNYNIPSARVPGATLPLVFDRFLRPGAYQVVIKVEDLNSGAFYGESVEVEVPKVERALPATAADPETARVLAEANAAISSGDNTIQIVPPSGRYQTGLLRVDTLTTGRDVAEVHFSLDGSAPIIKRRPPFNVELDLGSLPRMRTLEVVAFDAEGNELARDRERLNAGSHRFEVRLVEPRRGVTYDRSLRAVAEVQVPEGESVERVEFYLNEELVAALYQPPWEHPIVLPEGNQVTYVRAVAVQPDGNFTEEAVFVNAPEYLEELDVQLVELYISVLDRQNRPVEGLSAEAFRVLEDGVEQTPVRFDKVTNLPIHAGVLLDVSASMAEEIDGSREELLALIQTTRALPERAAPAAAGESAPTPRPAVDAVFRRVDMAQVAALGFFQRAIRPQDRGTLVTFNDHPKLAAEFTNDVKRLAGGLAGLKAERGTALYDSVVFSLYYFNGIKGQRALIILSDGRDEHSQFSFEDTLEYARRAGVAIYSIGLSLRGKHGEAKRKLGKLAEETGGRAFFVDRAQELPGVYEEIERELRSRYSLAYQST